ncbi:peroxiredoxin [Roseomonas sp. SSH11]|uniref:Glutathione-dependent peroxiredoxin n=1 Tax=Pararoseomonas baculiformis TaxID=2820812 RepID=A0ABS4AB67_9PROT|nr:peroxiredoxin [Pararoseomonas baculiformis]MBP0443529.1 peroxiredoxin [Pararoseomonas baculiformis]
MPIQTGDAIPSTKIMQATPEGPKEVDTATLLGSGTVVLFGVPGAFTPTCSARHLPGFVQQAAALKAKGVDTVACVSVNDAFVMAAWGRDQGVQDELLLLADGSGAFIKALGLEMDLTARGMGVRSQRFALVAKDGKVSYLGVEQPGAFEVSSAEAVLAKL